MGLIREKVRKEESEIISEINITPLTDVFLVLLIIFMVATPMIIQSAIKVKLPQAVKSEQQDTKSVVITLTSERKIFISDKEVTVDTLVKELSLKLSKEDLIVVINADKGVSHGSVVQLLDAAKKAGATRIAIATEKKEKN